MDNKNNRLINEWNTNIQDLLIDAMISIKKNNPNLTHSQVMDEFQMEVDKFMKYHRNDRTELPKPIKPAKRPSLRHKDVIPMMKIPYGGNKGKR